MRNAIHFTVSTLCAMTLVACGQAETGAVDETTVREASAQDVSHVDVAAVVTAEIIEPTSGEYSFSNTQVYLVNSENGTVTEDGSGDIDLSSINDDGEVVVMITLKDMPGYTFWLGDSTPDPYQAVGIAKYTNGTEPTVSFGSDNWPDGFSAPQLSSDNTTLVFIDKDEKHGDSYEYSLAITNAGENTGRIIIDPKITNKDDN